MKIVNPHLAQDIHKQGMIMPPNKYGYIHLAVEIDVPSIFKSNSIEKKHLICEVKNICESMISERGEVRRADVFSAILIPPGTSEGLKYIERNSLNIHKAKFDLVVLIECNTVDDIDIILAKEKYNALEKLLKSKATFFHKVLARNSNRIAEVDKTKQGIFLFNYFYAWDTQTLLEVWEYTAGWWTENAKLTNSTPLFPLNEDSQYSLINHCRWDSLLEIMPALVLGRLGIKAGLNNFVLKNFTENNIVAMPILYKLV